MGIKRYKIGSWKLEIEAEFNDEEFDEEYAIKHLADRYMSASKFDQPGDHPIELLNGKETRKIENLSKVVAFYVYESVYGNFQWILKYTLYIHPFKSNHWWPKVKKDIITEITYDPFILEYEEIPFKYEIIADN